MTNQSVSNKFHFMGRFQWFAQQHNKLIKSRVTLFILTALSITIAIRVRLISSGGIPFHADEAVVGLMARHILQGERPVFFYGQAYMGSLDAWLIAIGFYLFGAEVWVIRVVQLILYSFTLITTAWIGKLAFDNWWVGVYAVWLLSIPTMNVTLYTTASLGGYGEALLIGNLLIGLGLVIGGKVLQSVSFSNYLWLLWGFLAGIGIWAFGLTLVFSIPTGIYLIYCLNKKPIKSHVGKPKIWREFFPGMGLILIGLVIGAAPWWLYLFNQDVLSPLSELGGQAIRGVEGGNWLSQVGQHTISLLLLGSTVIFGLRPPWDIIWIALPLLPLILIFWFGVVIHVLRNGDRFRRLNRAPSLLLWIVIAVLIGFVLTPFGADPSGRYFLPLAVPLAIFAGDLLWSWKIRIGEWVWVIIGFLLIYNLLGVLQSVKNNSPGITTQFYSVARIDTGYLPELISFLDAHGETRGYTNYWVSYPLAFLSGEELIYIPVLPYHLDFRYTLRDNRYQPYVRVVSESTQMAYITTNNPDLDHYLRDKFLTSGATWSEKRIGDYLIFYALSKPIRADEIGLGANYP